MIIVTGATGQLGRGIVEALVARVPPSEVGVSVRQPDKVQDLAARGVRVRRGDFDDPGSLAHAFEGASRVLMVSSNARAFGGDTLAQHRAAIDAARASGARRVVYTSHMAASAASKFPPMRDHAATEAMLEQSGLGWTSLRNGFYAASALLFMGDALTTGIVEAPKDGKVSWTTHADLAAAAAAVLAGEALFDGPTPPLTGTEALDLGDLAELASRCARRPMHRRLVSDDELGARMASRGAPPGAVDVVLGFYRASRDGEFAAVDGTLAELLGRSPIPMRDVIARKLAG